MSSEYAESRIREALKLARGNPTKARQQIIAWTNEDTKLLQALTRPHLTGIVAHAVGRVIHRENMGEESFDIPETPQALNMPPDTFGQEIMRALEGRDTTVFGREETGAPHRPKQASQSHIEALKKIAGRKKKDKP